MIKIKMSDELEWNVIYYNINERKINTFNVFHHGGFKEDVDKLLHKTNLSKEEFVEELHGLVMYYFWSRAEWEVLIRAWCGGDGDEEIKIDVATQLKWNWDKFVDYVCGHNRSSKNVSNLGTKAKADCLECQHLNSCINAYFSGTKVRCIQFGNIEKYVMKAVHNEGKYKELIENMCGKIKDGTGKGL